MEKASEHVQEAGKADLDQALEELRNAREKMAL